MAKRHVRKKKRRARSLRWIMLMLLAALLLVAVLVIRSACRREETARTADALWDGGWYQDDLSCIENDKALVKGMKAFKKKTGVRPYLTLLYGVEPEELDMFAQDQYEALFSDGGHLLVVYDEWAEDAYYLSARAGEGSGLSAEDVARLLSCLETAYADPANKTFADAFGAGFGQAAGEMSASAAGSGGAGLLLVLGVVLIVLSGLLIVVLRKRARAARRADRWADEDEYSEDEG